MFTNKPVNPTVVTKKLILLVDDDPIFRHGLGAFLKKHQQELSCAHADSPSAALASIHDFPPDIAVVDVALAGADGIEVIMRMKAGLPHLAIVALSMHDSSHALRAFKAGAQG